MGQAISKISYLKGLAEGAGLKANDTRDKLVLGLIDSFKLLAEEMEELEDQLDDEVQANERIRTMFEVFEHIGRMSGSLEEDDEYEDEYDDEYDEEDDEESEEDDDDFAAFMRRTKQKK